MPQQPLTPPPEKMIQEHRRADHTVASFVELVDRTSTRFQAANPIKRGTIYSTTTGADQRISDSYPSLFFLKEVTPLGMSDVRGIPTDIYCLWYWSTDEKAENSYNADVQYFTESTSYPIFTRTSTIRRKDYDDNQAIAYGSAFTGLTSVNITAAGSGYTSATGAIATGATVEFVVSGGALVEAIITNEGANVSSGGSITITGNGTGATATARIQPASATLIHQEKKELPDNDPYSHEFVEVIRVYRNPTGPELTTQSLGQESLIPAKYRTLVTHLITEQEVSSALAFPSSLTGNQAYIEQAMQTMVIARKKIVEEIINSGTSLTGKETEEWGVDTIVETIVNDGTEPSEGYLVKASSVTPLGNGKSIKIVASYPSGLASVQLQGQEYDQAWDVQIPFVEKLTAQGVGIGDNRKDIKPVDYQRARTRTFDPTAIATVFDTYLNYMASTTNLQLPDVLTSVVGYISGANGFGSYDEAATGGGSGTTFFYSMSAHGEAQTSGSIVPEVAIGIKQYWARNVPIVTYYFFIQSPVTVSAILTKLQSLSGLSITAWPKFVPEGHTIILSGQKISAEARVKTGFQASSSSDGSSATDTGGQGSSFDTSSSIRAVRIPPTIHADIDVTGTINDVRQIYAIASATDPINNTLTEEIGAIGSEIYAAGGIETGYAHGLGPGPYLPATSVTAVPTSGVYLLRSEPVLRRFGYVLVACDTVDMAGIA